MNEEEMLYLEQLTDLSDIPGSLQHFHNEYEQAKAKLSVVASETAQEHRTHKLKLQKDIREARKYIRLGENLLESIERTHKPPSDDLIGKISAIDNFSKVSKYLNWIKFLHEAVDFFEKRQTGEMWQKCLPVYDELNCYCSMMEETQCENLKRIMLTECNKSYAILTDYALRNFEPLNWKKMSPEMIASTSENLKFLFRISEPLKHGESNIGLGMEWLMVSFKTQFKFHFMRKVKTNNINKPEWYLTKILSWIKEYNDVFMDSFGILFQDESGENNANSLFVDEFSKLIVMKLDDDLLKLSDTLFCHYIDEVIQFHKELSDIVTLSHIKTTVLDVFTRDTMLKRWLQQETMSSFEFLSNIEADDNCFEVRESGYNYQIPSMTGRVLTLVKTVGERVKIIPSLALNNCFYTLQCDILKEFLVHLSDQLRVLGHADGKFHLVVNSGLYITSVLEEWSYNTHYIKVSKFEEDESPFSNVLNSYTIFLQDSQLSLESSISSAVMTTFSGYFKQSWILPHQLETISPNCSEGLMELQQSLMILDKNLPDEMFLSIWSNLASSLQDTFLKKIIWKCQFNHAGAKQLKRDTQAFCGIFHNYCSPSYFAKFNVHIVVLSQLSETVRLWRGEGLTNPEGLQQLLDDQEIKMKVSDVLKILKQRVDV